jgi:hypothetical protein
MARRRAELTRRAGVSRRLGPPSTSPPLALLVRYAERSGHLRGSTPVRPYPVFTSTVRGKTYRLYTKPRGHSMFDIVFVRTLPRRSP